MTSSIRVLHTQHISDQHCQKSIRICLTESRVAARNKKDFSSHRLYLNLSDRKTLHAHSIYLRFPYLFAPPTLHDRAFLKHALTLSYMSRFTPRVHYLPCTDPIFYTLFLLHAHSIPLKNLLPTFSITRAFSQPICT